MSAMTFACPTCQTRLKPTKPIPAGKKVRCPKCSHVFEPPPYLSHRAALQAKPRVPTATQRRPESAEDGWEVVEDEAPPSSRKPPGDSIPLAQLDEPLPEAEPHREQDEPPPRRPLRKPQRSQEA